MSETVAIASVTGYIVLGPDSPNLEGWQPTEDPDGYGDRVLTELHVPGDGWRLTGGDDHGDGLTSYTFMRELSGMDEVRSFVDYANGNADDPERGMTPNMGLLTGPEEYGYIPAGLSWSLDGMDYNVGGISRIAGCDAALFPLSIECARYAGLV
jgi:hypothetical protein